MVACSSVRTDLNPGGFAGCRVFNWDEKKIKENLVRRGNLFLLPLLLGAFPYQLYEKKLLAFRPVYVTKIFAFYI